ncbi:MAG: tRNA (adenosine(37)-N6)-threonylcarbamoyltransferase complex ATPase subunit type 1 TsaE [Candidatus Levybacteria bacterium]|nr:tRNA (adenosine(37)-N6)-threonylcarbamoyltransferase complex ATPase subunit type 1 TsaE [Candidatus Levybacteria bacterium]
MTINNMTEEKTFITHNFEETQKVAEEFAKKLKGGEVIALHGELGAGKTTFVQGLAKGLGIERRIISPTFIIVRTYKINIKNQKLNIKNTRFAARRANKKSKMFYHIDLYRIESEKDLEGLGVREILNDQNSIVAIEWAEKLGKLLPKKRVDIYFDYISESKRRIIINYE